MRAEVAHADALLQRGNDLMALGRFAEAAVRYESALRLRPDLAEAANNLGVALAEQGKFAEAVPCYEHAIRLKPDLAEAHLDLGNALEALDRFEEAEAGYHRAVRLRPDWAVARTHLGTALRLQGKVAEALAEYDRAVELDPHGVEARFHRSLTRLLRGDLAGGWPEYEWRWKLPGASDLSPHGSPWDGADPKGRTILLRAEQGLGDTLQFVRYAPRIQAMGARVVLEVPGTLVPLLRRCHGIDQLIARGSPLPQWDAQAPLMSLPGLLGTTLDTIPADIPYLFADPVRIEQWRQKLAPLHGFKLGIAWQGNPDYPGDRRRSIPLAEFSPLFALDGVRLISLQKGPGTDQLDTITGHAIVDLGRSLDETGGAFMDTAAVMESLDLVITSDSAIAHLAGGLGVPVWVALSAVPDWRFLLDREDCPWYPTMRLFRQSRPGDWSGVFRRVAEELRTCMSPLSPVHGPSRSRLAPVS